MTGHRSGIGVRNLLRNDKPQPFQCPVGTYKMSDKDIFRAPKLCQVCRIVHPYPRENGVLVTHLDRLVDVVVGKHDGHLVLDCT